MTDQDTNGSGPENWSEFVERTNEAFASALEQNVEAQSRFVESWLTTLQQGTDDSSEAMSGGLEGYAKAYDVWMRAAEEQFERMADSMEGEEVSAEELRDIWLNAANTSFKEMFSSPAYAAGIGKTVGDALDVRREMDEMAEATLHDLGLATAGDVQEVGERLVELERRQHAVEQKLDRIIEALEE